MSTRGLTQDEAEAVNDGAVPAESAVPGEYLLVVKAGPGASHPDQETWARLKDEGASHVYQQRAADGAGPFPAAPAGTEAADNRA
jgi:hypothetical protein